VYRTTNPLERSVEKVARLLHVLVDKLKQHTKQEIVSVFSRHPVPLRDLRDVLVDKLKQKKQNKKVEDYFQRTELLSRGVSKMRL